MAALEKEIEKKLVRRIEKLGGLCWKFISPNCPGVPDRIVMLPGGRLIFVELKAEWGREANLQKYRREQLKKIGMDARVIKGMDKLDEFLKEVEDEIHTA